MAELDQQFVEYVVKSLVNHPDDVSTDRKIDEQGILVTLHVNPEDMGYVIGKEGKTAQALRTLLRTVGAKMNLKVHLRIYEPEGEKRDRPVRSQQEEELIDDPLDTSALDDIKL